MTGTPVIVEPDTFGPWIGLAGVVVGAAITTVVDSLRSRRKERKDRLRGNQAAADELFAAVNAILVTRGMLQQAREAGEPIHEWIKLWMSQSERAQKASEELVRHGPIDLAELGMEVAHTANTSPVSIGAEGFPKELETLLTKFAVQMRITFADPVRAAMPTVAANTGTEVDPNEVGSKG